MKKAVKACKDAVENVVRILRPHSMSIDVEFMVVPEALYRLLKTTLSYSQLEPVATPDVVSLMMRLSDLVGIYNSQLEHIHKDTQGFLRVVQSPRIHHSLFIRNTLIFQTCNAVLESLHSAHRSRGNKGPNGAIQPTTPTSMMMGAFSSCGLDVSLEDPSAAQFWLKNWPNDDFLVPWPLFQAALLTEFPNASLKSLSSLQYFLDFSHTQMVSKPRLNTLCKLSPSFEDLVAFPAILMSKQWFAGYLSKSEATMLLHQEPLNTFLVRLHKKSRGTLACSYVSNRGVQHQVIVREKFGYSMSHCAGTFNTIDELIAHNVFLQHELAEPWMRSNHFLGEATKEEAESILEGLNEGVYVIRLQHMPSTSNSPILMAASVSANVASVQKATTPVWRETAYVISVNSGSGFVKHAVIPRDLQGQVVVNSKTYVDLQAYLEAHKTMFSMPFSPSLPRFRSHLDSKLSPSLSASSSAAARFSASLSMSGSSLSLSSSVGIPRSFSSDSDFSSPNISQDDLSIPNPSNFTSSTLTTDDQDDDIPIIDVMTLSLNPPTTSSKQPWKPLTRNQINPLGITYKDMWAELLRYYHVPVPEAKIPPKTMDHF